MVFINTIDIFLFKLINQSAANSFFDWLMPAITDLHYNKIFSITVITILLLSLLYKFKSKGLVYFLFLILAVATNDFSGSKVKRAFNRPRPFQNIETSAIQRSPASENTSFYSNHASNNFTFATFISFIFPETKLIIFSIAAVVSYSRVYNGVHYPSDIIAGGLIGILWGYLFYYLCIKALTYFRKDPL